MEEFCQCRIVLLTAVAVLDPIEVSGRQRIPAACYDD